VALMGKPLWFFAYLILVVVGGSALVEMIGV
jgi:hypothetical protein